MRFPQVLSFAAAGLPQGAVIIPLFRDRLEVVLDRRERRCVRVCASPCSSAPFFRDGDSEGIRRGTEIAPDARSAALIDESTGTVLFEKNSRDKLPPASITKIMTMPPVMEDLDAGRIRLDEKVRVREHAASMGGSQIFLEPGEQMTVRIS